VGIVVEEGHFWGQTHSAAGLNAPVVRRWFRELHDLPLW
jgi:hypothetical protein